MNSSFKRTIILYTVMLIIFAFIFFLAYASLNKKVNLFGIRGLPAEFEDWLIMILSIGSMIRIIYELSILRKPAEESG